MPTGGGGGRQRGAWGPGGADSSLHRGAEILFSLAAAHARRSGLASQYPLSNFALLTEARRTLGLFQHHDAITGTAKEAVVVDYGVRCGPAPPGLHALPIIPEEGPAGRSMGGGHGQASGSLVPRAAWTLVVSPTVPLLSPRLLRSLVSLKQVIINAAHYLVLGDKEAYHFNPEAPFLQMVSPGRDLLGTPGVGSPAREQGVGVFLLVSSLSWVSAAAGPRPGHGWGGGRMLPQAESHDGFSLLPILFY